MLLATVSQAPYWRGGVRQATGDKTAILLFKLMLRINGLRKNSAPGRKDVPQGLKPDIFSIVTATIEVVP